MKFQLFLALLLTACLCGNSYAQDYDYAFSGRFICRFNPAAPSILIKLVKGQETIADFKIEAAKAKIALGIARKNLKNAAKKSPGTEKYLKVKDKFRVAEAEKLGIRACKLEIDIPFAPVVPGPKTFRATFVAERRYYTADGIDQCVVEKFIKFADIKNVEWEKVSWESGHRADRVKFNESPIAPPFHDSYLDYYSNQTFTAEPGFHHIHLGSAGGILTSTDCTAPDLLDVNRDYDNAFVHIK